ncbi:HDOD domain-containing protein [Nitrosomonas sp.]|uniref:HDOD domain-containing protein n=1 Tax=Nitrosomonas sp. TaxID=42353 RepID=UPI002081CAA2|nr:HDOD domain-containing protein [Nitrosomonas sp.]GJL76717.1 MAG: hypothetical protein NMNS02_28230 [Nitrosomonas sp.]
MKNLNTAIINSSSEDEAVSIKDKLIDMICNDPDLPTLGSSISNVVQLTSSDGESLEQLTHFILSDPSLTLKILRLSNSISYRTGASSVTCISKAIQLLGMDTIKACALAMMLVDGMPSKNARVVRHELMLALSASLIGRSLAKRSTYPNAEEVAIASLFKNLGRLILAAYDERLYREILILAKKDDNSEARASLQKLGCTFGWLTEFALREWNIPESIIIAMKIMPGKVLKRPKNRIEWMQQVAEFSESTALLALSDVISSNAALNKDLVNRFGESLLLDSNGVDALVNESSEQMRAISSHTLNLQAQEKAKEPGENDYRVNQSGSVGDLSNRLMDDMTDIRKKQLEDGDANGKPFSTVDQLQTGARHVSEMIASGQYNINALFKSVLETYYSSLGFQFVTVCLKDVQTNLFRARNSLGLNHDKIQESFVFPDSGSNDLFSMAIKKNVDLSISNATDPKIRSALPSWHIQLLPEAKSFMILPLVVGNKPIGLFYADRSTIAAESMSINEMKLIKLLKTQILMALSS